MTQTTLVTDTADTLAPLGLGRNSAVLIVGLGKTGFSIARFLAAQGLRFAITDTRAAPPYLGEFRETFPDAAVFMGGFQAAAFEAATHLIVSPGVSLQEPLIRSAVLRGLRVLGDLDLFACMARAPVLAITGANGKSTVTTLVGLMAEANGTRARVGGNLGTPMLDLLDEGAQIYVLELSSFQLESSHLLEPLAATVLNISPDHMDRYEGLDDYAQAKQRIFNGQGLMVLNRDDPRVAAMATVGREIVWFSLDDPSADYGVRRMEGDEWVTCQGQPLLKTSEIKLRGRHNLANVLASLALADRAGFSREACLRALRSFAGLEHRAQWVGDFAGISWINDSKATNVGACIAALNGMEKPVILIAGGDGKGADFRVLRDAVARKVKALVLMGRDAGLIEQAVGDLVKTVRVNAMRQAVEAAKGLAQAGDVVLLAPACASLDQFKDYQERGRVFAEEAGRMAE